MRLRLNTTILGLVAALAVSACVFRDVSRQQAKLGTLCTLSGTVETASANDAPVVILLVAIQGTAPPTMQSVRLADHFVRNGDGHWMFYASPGKYGLAAFEDRNQDLVYQPDEPYLRVNLDALIDCSPGGRIDNIALMVPEEGRPRFDGELDVAAVQVRSPEEQLRLSLGMVTAVGDVSRLDDGRFAEAFGPLGLWRPFDFLVEARPGIYFLEDYDADKVPVLFVHGANGTPRNFRFLIDSLDRKHFQPWVYFYPSGAKLDLVASHLDQTMMKLWARFGFKKVLVVAHSMGGLVARAFVRAHHASRGADIPLLVTLATPWGGHDAARIGVEHAPAVVRSWFDMAPGSPFLTGLFQGGSDGNDSRMGLPDGTHHHLLFAFHRNNASFGASDDEVVTVASQLRWDAQASAERIYGFDATHMGILSAEPVAAVVNAILADAVN